MAWKVAENFKSHHPCSFFHWPEYSYMCGFYALSDANNNNNNNNNNNFLEKIQKIDSKPRKIVLCIQCTTRKLKLIGYMYKEEAEEACYKLKRHTKQL